MSVISHTFQVAPEDLQTFDSHKHDTVVKQAKDKFRTKSMVKIRVSLIFILIFLSALYLLGLYIRAFYIVLLLSVLFSSVFAWLGYIFMKNFDNRSGFAESVGFKSFLASRTLKLASLVLWGSPHLVKPLTLDFMQDHIDIIIPIVESKSPVFKIFSSAAKVDNEYKSQNSTKFQLEYNSIQNIQELPNAWIIRLKNGLMKHKFLVLPKRIFLNDEIDFLKSKIDNYRTSSNHPNTTLGFLNSSIR